MEIKNNVSVVMIETNELKQLIRDILFEYLPRTEKEEEILLSAKDTAETLDVDRSTLWRWRKNNYLVPVLVGGKVRYKMSDIQKLMGGAVCLTKS